MPHRPAAAGPVLELNKSIAPASFNRSRPPAAPETEDPSIADAEHGGRRRSRPRRVKPGPPAPADLSPVVVIDPGTMVALTMETRPAAKAKKKKRKSLGDGIFGLALRDSS